MDQPDDQADPKTSNTDAFDHFMLAGGVFIEFEGEKVRQRKSQDIVGNKIDDDSMILLFDGLNGAKQDALAEVKGDHHGHDPDYIACALNDLLICRKNWNEIVLQEEKQAKLADVPEETEGHDGSIVIHALFDHSGS